MFPDDAKQRDPPRSPTLGHSPPGSQLSIAFLVFVSSWIIDIPAAITIHEIASGNGEHLAALIARSFVVAKYFLWGVWFAWGGANVLLRTVTIYLSVLSSCAILWPNERTLVKSATLAWTFTLVAAVVAAPRLFGVCWIVLGKSQRRLEAIRSRQFTLEDLFLWTGTAAVVVVFFRWCGMPFHPQIPIGELVLVSVIATFGLASLILLSLTVLGPNTRPMLAKVALTLTLAFLEGLVISKTSIKTPQLGQWLLFGSLTALPAVWLLLTLGMLRHFGHRLVVDRR